MRWNRKRVGSNPNNNAGTYKANFIRVEPATFELSSAAR